MAARHFSIKDFFRQTPNALLARYFYERALFGDLDFSALKETPPDELFAAWLTMPDALRHEMNAEFREIFDLSDEKGFRPIIDEASWHLEDGTQERRLCELIESGQLLSAFASNRIALV